MVSEMIYEDKELKLNIKFSCYLFYICLHKKIDSSFLKEISKFYI